MERSSNPNVHGITVATADPKCGVPYGFHTQRCCSEKVTYYKKLTKVVTDCITNPFFFTADLVAICRAFKPPYETLVSPTSRNN
jgi:hypothetical protein